MMDLRQLLERHDRLMVLAPHPDDETLATAGVLQWAARLGAETRVVFMTDGENNPWAQRATERRWRITRQDQLRWGARRRREAIRALTCLGLRPDRARFLGLPDQLLTESLTADPEGSTRMLVDELRSWTTSADVDSLLHDRAAWMSSLLGSRTPLRANAPTELELLMAADSLATAGYPRAALASGAFEG